VWWETLKDHTEGFKKSADYQEWRRLLHHFYDPFPNVEYYASIAGQGRIPDD
jgi:heme-degrading monooxygenase HmoA